MKHELPKLPYSYNSLEPFIDEQTMTLHHTKHHQTYVDKLNGALDKHPELFDLQLTDLLKDNMKNVPEDIRTAVKNHGGGHLNHSLFWNIMAPVKEINEKLNEELSLAFGSVDEFKKKFSETALNHFGSGWAWLVKTGNEEFEIYSLPNQDSPYLKNHTPIIGLDLWEHAYYLKYQNRRQEYIEKWWNVLKMI